MSKLEIQQEDNSTDRIKIVLANLLLIMSPIIIFVIAIIVYPELYFIPPESITILLFAASFFFSLLLFFRYYHKNATILSIQIIRRLDWLIRASDKIPLSQSFGDPVRLREEIFDYDEKKKEILKVPKTFYYLDEPTTVSMFNEIYSSVRTREITFETDNTARKGIEADFPIKPSFRSDKSTRQTMRAEVVETVESQFNTVLKYLFSNHNIELNTERFYRDEDFERDLQITLNSIREKNLAGNQTIKQLEKEFFDGKRRRQLDFTLGRLKAIKGYILVVGEFSLFRETEEWQLTLSHPINQELELEKPIIFKSYCSLSNMKHIGKDAFSKTDKIRIALFGSILKFAEDTRELLLYPIAIYS